MALGLILLFSFILTTWAIFSTFGGPGWACVNSYAAHACFLSLSFSFPAPGRHSFDGHGSLRATDGVFLSGREAAIKENSWWFDGGSGIKTTHLLLTFALLFCTLYIDPLIGRTLKW